MAQVGLQGGEGAAALAGALGGAGAADGLLSTSIDLDDPAKATIEMLRKQELLRLQEVRGFLLGRHAGARASPCSLT